MLLKCFHHIRMSCTISRLYNSIRPINGKKPVLRWGVFFHGTSQFETSCKHDTNVDDSSRTLGRVFIFLYFITLPWMFRLFFILSCCLFFGQDSLEKHIFKYPGYIKVKKKKSMQHDLHQHKKQKTISPTRH